MKVCITGGAGFIGSNLAAHLLKNSYEVTIIDNLSSGFMERVPVGAKLYQGDLTLGAESGWGEALENADTVVHLAANVDNRFSWKNPHLPLEQNVTATLNLALAASDLGVKNFIYSSTGTAYGDKANPPYKENEASSSQTSLYGATKYAAEGILSVFSSHKGLNVNVFRFVGVLGPGYSHGHVFDFVKKLVNDPAKLDVLGDGQQKKAYVHVFDVCEAIMNVIEDSASSSSGKFEVFNLGRRDFCTVNESISWITSELGLKPELNYTGETRGWIGDNPHLYLDTNKIESLGWKPQFELEDSIRATAKWLLGNQWIFQKH